MTPIQFRAPLAAEPLFVFGLDPIFVFIAVGMLFAVFFLFFLLRRSLLSLRKGFDEGRRR